MSIVYRILLAFYTLVLAVFSASVFWISLKPEKINIAYTFMSNMLDGNRVGVAISSLLLFVLSIVFLFSGFRSDKDKRAVVRKTDIGEIKISLSTIENIALAASKKLSGIKDSKAYVYRINDGVSITIKAVVFNDINIPVLSEDIQVKVKSSVEETTGVKVEDVKIVVENIANAYKARVE